MGLLGTAYLPVHSRRRGSEREVQGVAVLGEDRRQSASISHARRAAGHVDGPSRRDLSDYVHQNKQVLTAGAQHNGF